MLKEQSRKRYLCDFCRQKFLQKLTNALYFMQSFAVETAKNKSREPSIEDFLCVYLHDMYM